MYDLKSIAEITGAGLDGRGSNAVTHFLTDSRGLQFAGSTLFVALESARNNGHLYIPGLIESGVKNFLIRSGAFDTVPYRSTDVSFLVSENPLKTLQALAIHHRSKFELPVIGITGSNGKTVVKEWLYQALKDRFTICRSPKSYNSQIGVALSVLNLDESHTLGIFEAGISQPGEMDVLEQIIRPTLGVLTSIGTAHDEGFESREQKIVEKLKLFRRSASVVTNGLRTDDLPQDLRSRTTRIGEDGDFSISGFNLSGSRGEVIKLQTVSTDLASVNNAATCAVVLTKLEIPVGEIESRIRELHPVALRLEIKTGIQNSLLINDYYNSDLDSLKIALNYLEQQNRRARKVIVLSDIEQSGISSRELYRQIAELFRQFKIDHVVGIGPEIGKFRPMFSNSSVFFQSTTDFISQVHLVSHHFHNATILLKGARSFGFESISRVLQQKSHDTEFEINLTRLTDNINYYRGLLSPGVSVMCMVKAMGYGSGGAEIARTLQHVGVRYLAVAYADEGVELKQSSISLPVMVMSPETDSFEDIINYRLEPEIYSFRILEAFARKLDEMGNAEPYPVHIKIDTGMHRLGFEEKDVPFLVQELKKLPQLRIASVFSHLAASDNPAFDEFTEHQLTVFKKAFETIESGLDYRFLKHICNSGGITRFRQAHFDMVRLGIGMYGIGVNEKEQKKLQNVGSLKTRISQIKTLEAGETVGYNRAGLIEDAARIATIPIGYADGFSRLLGHGKHGVYVNGLFCKTVGSICMDMCMIDVTRVNCAEGDEVIIFENVQQITDLAKALNTIPYEVLTSVSARVKRVYVQE